jgi:hypothetical protein
MTGLVGDGDINTSMGRVLLSTAMSAEVLAKIGQLPTSKATFSKYLRSCLSRNFFSILCLSIKLPQMMVGMFIGQLSNLFFCHFSEERMYETGV